MGVSYTRGTSSLNRYLKWRRFNKEELGPESVLFKTYENPHKKKDHLGADSVRQMLVNLLKLAGIERKKTKNRYDKAIVYGFRKRFNGILKMNNDVNSNIAEKLMAHKNGLDGNYLKPTREQCFVEFVKAITELTISDEARDKAKIADLEKEKSVLQKEVIPLSSRMRRTDAKVERLLKAMSEINPEYVKILEIRKSGPY